MDNTEEYENPYDFEGNEESDALDKLLASPDVQKAISRIPDIIEKNIDSNIELKKTQLEIQTTAARGATKWILIWTVILALAVVTAVSILAWHRILSSDAVTFLLGTIVGAAFTFLRNFFPRSN